MIQATIVKGFKHDTIAAHPTYEVKLGLAPAEGTRTTTTYRKGKRVEFAGWSDFMQFYELAEQCGGAVEIR